MDDRDNGQLLDMDSSDQQTSQIDSQIDSEMDSQQSSQDYDPTHHHHHHHHDGPLNVLESHTTKKRQSTESNSSSVVGKYWRSKSLPVAYLPPFQTLDQNNFPNNGVDVESNPTKNQPKDSKDPSKRNTSACQNCRGGSTRNKPNCGVAATGVPGTGRCCRGSHGSANSHDSVNNGKVKSLGGGSSAEHESGEVKKKSDWRTLQQHYYPEGGWGYIVTFCALSSHALALGVQLYLSTVVFQHFQIAWLGSFSMAVSMFLSPLWVSICKRKSTRLSAVFGGLIAALGCLFTSFATKFHQVFISYGFFMAVGVGLTRDASTLMVGQYFKRKRMFCEAIVVSGSGLGITLMSILVHNAISSLGWRLGLQAVTGTLFLTFFLGMCYRSSSLYHPQRRAILHLKNQKRKVKEKEKKDDRIPFIDFSCLRSKTLQILVLSTSFTSFGIFTPLLLLVVECSKKNFEDSSILILHIYVGIFWIAGCITIGFLAIQQSKDCVLSKQYLCQMTSVICGISIMALTLVTGPDGLVIFTCVYSFGLGGYSNCLKIYTYERVRARHFPRAWSFVQCSQSVPVACGVAVTGYINSVLGWKVGYYLAAVAVFLGTSFLFLTDVRRRRLSRKKTNNSSMKTNETTETVQSPKARKISFSFPIMEPIAPQSKHDSSNGQNIQVDPALLKDFATCISEEGFPDIDFQDLYFGDWADYFNGDITSCGKVENCLLSEYDPEYAVLIEKRARRYSAVRPNFAQAVAVASGVVRVGANNDNGENRNLSTVTGSTTAGNSHNSASTSSYHHRLLAPGSFHIIPATAPLASGENAEDSNMTMSPEDSSQASGMPNPREISVFRNTHPHPPRSGRRSTVEPPSRSITVIDEASV